MRSSNYKHLKTNITDSKKPSNKAKKISKLCSLIITAFIVVSAVVIPSISMVQNVSAISDDQKPTEGVGNTNILNDAIITETEKKETKKSEKKTPIKETEPETEAETVTEPETETWVEETEPETEQSNDSYFSGEHIELSDYDRTLLEGLVMGEAGGSGYECSALVAQAIHDSMIESGTTSVESIAYEYGYDASMWNSPTSDVKSAVSFIFDSDGRAVDHRILYFYSSDMVSSTWHESQNFITSSDGIRFFDKW